MMKIPKNNVFNLWLKNLEKLGPSESSVLIILYNANQFRNEEKLEELMVEISGETLNYVYYKTKNHIGGNPIITLSDDFDLFNLNPRENSVVLIKNFKEAFNKNKSEFLFNKCRNNVIIFFQADHLDNFDPDFIEDYCTVVIL